MHARAQRSHQGCFELGEALGAPTLLHPADEMLCRMTHPYKDFRNATAGLVLQA